jgi:hypothetical protein
VWAAAVQPQPEFVISRYIGEQWGGWARGNFLLIARDTSESAPALRLNATCINFAVPTTEATGPAVPATARPTLGPMCRHTSITHSINNTLGVAIILDVVA